MLYNMNLSIFFNLHIKIIVLVGGTMEDCVTFNVFVFLFFSFVDLMLIVIFRWLVHIALGNLFCSINFSPFLVMKVQHLLLPKTLSNLVSLLLLIRNSWLWTFRHILVGLNGFWTEVLYYFAGFGVGHMRDTQTKGSCRFRILWMCETVDFIIIYDAFFFLLQGCGYGEPL